MIRLVEADEICAVAVADAGSLGAERIKLLAWRLVAPRVELPGARGAAGRRHVAATYRWHDVADGYEALLGRLARSR